MLALPRNFGGLPKARCGDTCRGDANRGVLMPGVDRGDAPRGEDSCVCAVWTGDGCRCTCGDEDAVCVDCLANSVPDVDGCVRMDVPGVDGCVLPDENGCVLTGVPGVGVHGSGEGMRLGVGNWMTADVGVGVGAFRAALAMNGVGPRAACLFSGMRNLPSDILFFDSDDFAFALTCNKDNYIQSICLMIC